MSYTIKSGDTLGEIAEKYNITVAQLLAVNPNIKDANSIRVGDVISIPSAATSSSSNNVQSYTVVSGDTLGGIAVKYKTTVTDILAANPTIKDANAIRVGQTINIPTEVKVTQTQSSAGTSQIYVIASGDSLSSIADKYNITLKQLLNANPTIKDANRIRVGQVLVIPKPQSALESLSSQIIDFLTLKWIYETKPPVNVEISALEPETDDEIEVLDNTTAVSTGTTLFNREKFFQGYRTEFGSLKQSQVEGLEFLLSSFENDDKINYIKSIAYILSTIKHETAETFQPITEYGNKAYFNRYDPVLADSSSRRERAKRNGNTQKGDGYKYRGRGYVQITWKNNYQRLGDALGYDLVNDPDKALKPDVAYQILSYGMRNGAFTGKKLKDYISENQADYLNARRIINGTDRAETLKGYAESFESILLASKT